MNAMLATARPLPVALDQFAQSNPIPSRMRRHSVAGFDLSQMEVDRFNAFLFVLGRTEAPFQIDQLATAARGLSDRSIELSPTVGRRMRRAAAAALMLADPSWEAANDAIAVASLVVGYVRTHNDLIPDELPRVGRLDDAIVIDTAWPQLADEVDDYLDYRRVRRIEARLRGRDSAGFQFSRGQWEQAAAAEAALAEHQRQVRDRSYLPAPTSRFRIH